MLKPKVWLRRTAVDGTKHNTVVRVRYTNETEPYRQARIVASQLRVLAVNTDGRPAVAGSFDAEFMERGMRFRFTSAVKREEFKGRVQNYLSRTVTRRLVFSA